MKHKIKKRSKLAMAIALGFFLGTSFGVALPVQADTIDGNGGFAVKSDGTIIFDFHTYNTAFGIGATAKGVGATAWGQGATALGVGATAFGNKTEANGQKATAFGDSTTAVGANATAFGDSTTAGGVNATAWGQNATAGGANATAFGYTTLASGDYATAFGYTTRANGTNATAFGSNTIASGTNATAFGFETIASGDYATAFGIRAKAGGQNSLAALGGITGLWNDDTYTKGGKAAVAIGEGAVAAYDYTYAIGKNAKASNNDSFALGNDADASGLRSFALGNNALVDADADYGIAIGNSARARANDSIAIGTVAIADGISSIAIGENSYTFSKNSVALGANSKTEHDNVVSVGNSDLQRKIVNMDNGTIDIGSTEAVNGGQIYNAVGNYSTGAVGSKGLKFDGTSGSEKLVANVNIEGVEATFSGKVKGTSGTIDDGTTAGSTSNYFVTGKTVYDALQSVTGNVADAYTTSATVSGSTANLTLTSKIDTSKTITFGLVAGDNITFAQDGNNIKISATDGTGGGGGTQSEADVLVHKGGDADKTAIIGGANTEATGKNGLALGNSSKANAENAVSIGYKNELSNTATNSTAVGAENIVTGERSTAVGYKNTVTGNRSGAFGDPNNISGSGSYALGNDNTVTGNNTFVIGNNVTASSNNSVILGNGSADGGANTVSVGAAGAERKIVNVAPGTNETDAVNYGQLQAALGATGSGDAFYALQDKVENMGNRIDKMGTKINKVGAGAAALAAMHPVCDDDCNLSFSAGLGAYKGERAVAVGMFYRFNPRVMMNCGAAVGNDNNMYNIGFNFALDRNVEYNLPSKAAMAKQIELLTAEVEELKKIILAMQK